uniref:Macaca fascicularis brain cDNA clone: QflA-11890, similar to human muskelin 1, intracellular mediator containing kelchmotifs (MKLN1), mRNA, RefSeq: NM_013255.3 n=1 Tax=Macaca fascicularis TaxID=9541 RepID=I7GKG3_MACFA|nr:unnamed protein product [Macaca fascicularis]
MYSQFLVKDPAGKPAMKHFHMQFGGSLAYSLSLSSCCNIALYHLGC